MLTIAELKIKTYLCSDKQSNTDPSQPPQGEEHNHNLTNLKGNADDADSTDLFYKNQRVSVQSDSSAFYKLKNSRTQKLTNLIKP